MDRNSMIIRCLNCGRKNRIPKERMGHKPVCGHCRAPLDEMIIRCLGCGKKNRMPENRLHEKPLCGNCHVPLVIKEAHYSPMDVTDATFHAEVLSHKGSVLVDCWAPWCSPCRLVAPIIDDLALKHGGLLKTAKLNVDENPLTASKYDVRSIPTLLFIKDGALANRLVGAQPQEEIERHIQALLKT